jgi:outer membrane protein TolC
MLRITLHDAPKALTFQVEGRLVGEWAKELERSWKNVPNNSANKTIIIDLTGVLFIDREGKRVLAELCHAGAKFRCAGAMNESIVSEVRCESRRKQRGALLSAAILLLIGVSTAKAAQSDAAATPLRLTLRDAVQLALKQNPQVQVANLSVAVTQESQIIARSALLPQANLGVSEAVQRENLEAFLGTSVPGFPQHSGPFWIFQGGPSGSVPLLDLTAWHRWRQSKENTTGAHAQEQTVREQDVLLVVSQYLGSLRATADVGASQSRVDLAKALLDQATDMQKSGVGTRIDTVRANVQYQNEQQRLIEARTSLNTSLFGLARLLSIDPHQPIELADASEFFKTPAYTAAETLEQAFDGRPETKALASQVRAEELEKRAARSVRWPRIALNGSWNEEGLSPASAIPAYDFSAALEGPLYTGGRIRAQIATAEIELKKLAQQQTDLRNQIAQEVRTAAAQLDAAKNEVDVANSGIALATEEVTQARDRFQAGVANNIEVITAQDELARANDNQIVALYRYNQARADLAHATGQMELLYAK